MSDLRDLRARLAVGGPASAEAGPDEDPVRWDT